MFSCSLPKSIVPSARAPMSLPFYRARPGEPFRAPLVWANNAALRVYQSARRRLGVTDEGVSRALRWARGERGP